MVEKVPVKLRLHFFCMAEIPCLVEPLVGLGPAGDRSIKIEAPIHKLHFPGTSRGPFDVQRLSFKCLIVMSLGEIRSLCLYLNTLSLSLSSSL